MDRAIKINFFDVFKSIFGFSKENDNLESIEKEVEKIRAISDGIQWKNFSANTVKREERISEKTNFKENVGYKKVNSIQSDINKGRDRE